MLLLLLACTDEGEDSALLASIEILSPADGATVCGRPLVVELAVTGLELVDPFSGGTEPGTGHVDVTLNGQDPPDDAGMGGERIEVPDVAEGRYQLRAELSNADHTPVEPYTEDHVVIDVAASAC